MGEEENQKSSKLVWVYLIFMAFAAVIAGVERIKNPPPPVPGEEIGILWVWICLASWTVLGAIGFWIYRSIGWGSTHVIEQNDALVLIELGRLSEAAEIFDKLIKNRESEINFPIYVNSR